jgi:hypothetical protein
MGYRAGLRRYPEQHLTVAMLSNTASINVGPVQVANLYLADHFEASGGEQQAAYEPPTAIELSADELARYEGTYWNETESLMRTIEIHDAKLFYARGGGNATELGAVATGHFFMVGLEIPVNVEFQGSGGSRTMTVGVEDEDLLLFELIPSSSGDAVTAYAGAYWSDDLLRELRVEVEGEVVFASWADEEDRTAGRLLHIDDLLLPRFIPVPWYPQDTRLLFERDDAGSISGLSLSCDMVRGVKFSKQP